MDRDSNEIRVREAPMQKFALHLLGIVETLSYKNTETRLDLHLFLPKQKKRNTKNNALRLHADKNSYCSFDALLNSKEQI
jgi:hypothetical protein